MDMVNTVLYVDVNGWNKKHIAIALVATNWTSGLAETSVIARVNPLIKTFH